MKKKNTHILMLEKDDPEKEMEFEISFQLSLSVKQRYKRMMKLSQQTMDYVKKHNYPKTPSIICRS